MHYCTLEWSLPDFLRSITVHIVFHLQLGAPKLGFAPRVLPIQEFVHRFGSGLLMVWSVVVGRKLVENGSKSQASKSPSSIPDQFSLLSRVSFNWINKEPSTMCSWWKWWISVAACEESIVLRVGFFEEHRFYIFGDKNLRWRLWALCFFCSESSDWIPQRARCKCEWSLSLCTYVAASYWGDIQ